MLVNCGEPLEFLAQKLADGHILVAIKATLMFAARRVIDNLKQKGK
jgi:hypothetical protein